MGDWWRGVYMVDECSVPPIMDDEYRYPSGYTMGEVAGFMEQLSAMVGKSTVSMSHIAGAGPEGSNWCACPQCTFERAAKKMVDDGIITQAQYAGSDGWERVYTPPPPEPEPEPPYVQPFSGVTMDGSHIYYEPHEPSDKCHCPTCRERFRTAEPGEKRATRAERERTIELLQLNYAEGALEDDELSVRIDSAMAAKFPSVLTTLLLDLPIDAKRSTPEQLADIRKVELARPKHARALNVLALSVTALAFAITVLTAGRSLYLTLPFCCVANALIGICSGNARKLAPIGWAMGVFMPIGTVIMILLASRTPKE